MEESKLMQRFLASMKMGSIMIKNIEKESKSLEYRKMWVDFLTSFSHCEQRLIEVMKRLNVKTDVSLTCLQKMAVQMQKVKLKGNDDFELLFFGIEGMEMGMVGIFKYIYIHDNLDRHFVSEMIEIYEEYERAFHLMVKKAKNVLNFESRKENKEIEEI